MIKKSFLFLLTILIVGCNPGKSVIQTTKNGTSSGVIKSRKTSSNNPKSEILEATSRVKVSPEMVLDYIKNYKTVAQANMKKYGIPASIILGQALLESGSGTGTLCVQANNHFGIKCGSDWSGQSVKYNDDAIDECFRKYKNSYDSFSDHSLFLTTKKRYANLFNLDHTDYKAWAMGLKEAGYATDSLYPSKLITLIEKYQLYQYDETDTSHYTNQEKTIKQNLKFDSHIVAKGDTLYSISKKYNIPIDDLKRNNRLENDALAIGQTINILK